MNVFNQDGYHYTDPDVLHHLYVKCSQSGLARFQHDEPKSFTLWERNSFPYLDFLHVVYSHIEDVSRASSIFFVVRLRLWVFCLRGAIREHHRRWFVLTLRRQAPVFQLRMSVPTSLAQLENTNVFDDMEFSSCAFEI